MSEPSTRFRSAAGLPVPAVTTDQMIEVDRIAIEELGPNLFQMMEHAGRNLAAHVVATLGPAWREKPIVVLAGVGGNGGGGICAARHLANRGGDVSVVVTDAARLGDVPAWQLHVLRSTRARVIDATSDGRWPAEVTQPALVVDAVIGYRLRDAPRGRPAELVEWTRGQAVPVVALDVPSGVDATTGETPGAHVSATSTVTLALPKTGLTAAAAGELWLSDLGIPAAVFEQVGVPVPESLFADDQLIAIHRTDG